MNRPHLPRVVLLLMAVATWLFVVISIASFHVTDWPSHAVYPYEPTQNLCGTVGAVLAYFLFLILGQGVYPLLLFTGICLAAWIGKKPVEDLWLRAAGLALVCTAFAAIVHYLIPGSPRGLPEGQGGLLGIAAASYLESNLGIVGARLALMCAIVVGLLLAADDLMMATPSLVAAAAANIRNAPAKRKQLHWSDIAGLPGKLARQIFDGGCNAISSLTPKPAEKPKKKPVAMDDEDEDLKAPVILKREPEPPAEAPKISEPAIDKPAESPAVRPEIVVKMASPLRPPPRPAPQPPRELGEYQFPSWDALAEAEYGDDVLQEKTVREQAAVLEQALREFNIESRVVAIDTGPVITMYEISLASGIKVSAITALSNDIMRALKAESVRIQAPVPGKDTVGIEVPNSQKVKVRLKELMELAPDATTKMSIPLYLGKDASGEPLITDLAAMPHCLIAGTTGSGKSVCINTVIMSILYHQRPDQVKLILVDPKMVEMAAFKEVPHLMCPVIHEPARATSVLEWACQKMDERYEFLAEAQVRNIKGYNALTRDELVERFHPESEEEEARIPKKLPYIIIIIDELADLMMTSGKEVESHIVRLSQKSRAVGIHLILATQRPQANVVTGLIKSNMPSRIAFRVSSKMDSRIVLDQNGAETLLGQGDMLFLPPGASKPIRSQGTFIDDKEIRDSVRVVREQAEAQYEPELVQIRATTGEAGEMEKDELYDDAVRVVLQTKRGSVSLLQRRLTIGYSRASRLIEQMAQCGILGDYKGSQAREVNLTLEEWDAAQAQQQKDAEDGMSV
jgi:DNA segregation ATPase FtsK/SpoIIIE, S-DNA-T family